MLEGSRDSMDSLREDLIVAVEQRLERPLAPAVREALLQVPRHIFVPNYYEHRQKQTAPASSDEQAWHIWLQAIYRDQALTTQLDERGLPISSSSQPSVMALMIEHLALQPGMRVLEIGTGTGYNAALLAALTGDPHTVTTIDIDPALSDQARSPIEQVVGEGMTILAGNGLQGYAPHAPYDRIIATGSFLPIPHAWIDQLAPAGRLVMDLRGRFAGGLLLVCKQADGHALGRFLMDLPGISFLHLRSASQEPATLPSLRGYQQFSLQEQVSLPEDDPAYGCATHFATHEQFRSQDAINLWLQWAFPELGIKWKGSPEALSAVLTDYLTQTVATVKPQTHAIEIMVYGARPLGSELHSAYQGWLTAGQPTLASSTLHIHPHGQQMMEHQGKTGTFLLSRGNC
jgi:protein-L-isoaspartate(D-aspartate) O-methyltransferase